MLRKLPLLLIAMLAVALLPQAATAKRQKPRAAHAVCVHGKKKHNKPCTSTSTSRARLATRSTTLDDPATTISDPATTISDPGTVISDPGTVITDPGTVITDPGTVITDPGTVITDPGTVITDPGTVITDPAPAPLNPAQACRAEESDPAFAAAHDGKDFAHFYGTNPNLRNAFGKCVSSHARAAGDSSSD